jgi:diguanylate cyclase (GGDEF)-like protein
VLILKNAVKLETLPSPKVFFLPGGVLVLATTVLVHSGLPVVTTPLLDSYYAACFGAGVVLAWRFHSTRVAMALVTLFLAERAILFFSGGHSINASPGRTAFALIAVLLPANFLVFSLASERGFAANALATRICFLFLQSVVVAAMCRPGDYGRMRFLDVNLINSRWLTWTRLPQIALLAFLVALTVLAFRFVYYRKPIESGYFWSLSCTALAFHYGAAGKPATIYLGTAALILLASVVETSYIMAYYDELTGVPARRAFNEGLLALEFPYAIAVVDIDYFKRFNDTYGHETGDHVLRLVAARLARVSGGGKAYRCGGEEFSIVFSGITSTQAATHLESLRRSIEQSPFKVRAQGERRSAPRGPDRRQRVSRKKSQQLAPAEMMNEEVTVTVSIGVAESITHDDDVKRVIQAADEALYRAKRAGRNQVEVSTGAISKQYIRKSKKAASH